MMDLNSHSNETENRIKSACSWIQWTECDSRGQPDDLVGLDEMIEVWFEKIQPRINNYLELNHLN